MRISTFIFAIVMIAGLVAISNAQSTPTGRVTFYDASFTGGVYVATISYDGLENSSLRLYEAVLSGPVEGCFDNYDFSRARLVSPDRAKAVWDPQTNTYTVKWTFKRDTKDTCRVLIGDGDGQVDGSDFLIWQRNMGTQPLLFSGESLSDSRTGDGSVRSVGYSVSLGGWH